MHIIVLCVYIYIYEKKNDLLKYPINVVLNIMYRIRSIQYDL